MNVNLNIRIDEQERTEFYDACYRNDEVPAEILRKLMRDYSTGAITYPVNQRGKQK